MINREELDRLMKDKADCDFIEEGEDENGIYRIYYNEELDKGVAFHIDELDSNSATSLAKAVGKKLKRYKVKGD